MNKELSALEALNIIKKNKGQAFCEAYKTPIDIIETALKDYEKKTKLAKEYKDVNNVAKRLKALEIIKEKFVIPAYIMNTENVGEYNKWLRKITFKKDYQKRVLTQEEYDLLKEVLE